MRALRSPWSLAGLEGLGGCRHLVLVLHVNCRAVPGISILAESCCGPEQPALCLVLL